MKVSVIAIIFLCIVTSLHGLGRYASWLKKTFRQADCLGVDYGLARSFVRSAAIYDHFATVALVDSLLISSDVIDTYARAYAVRRALPESFAQALAQEQREQGVDTIMFYLLITPAKPGPTLSLTPYAQWVASLRIEDKVHQPSQVRPVILQPEYQAIFGRRYSHFREAYALLFNVGKKERDRVIQNTVPLELTLRSTDHTVSLMWN